MVFEQIYAQYAPKVFRLCMGYVNDHEQAQDLMQETFVAVWQHLPAFRGESGIGTWIFRIASNNCLRSIEKNKKHIKAELPVQLADVKEDIKEEKKLQLLYRCIAMLAETERIIISLVLEDLPQAEIAAIMGLSEVNTRVKIHRIKEKLSQKMKQYGQF